MTRAPLHLAIAITIAFVFALPAIAASGKRKAPDYALPDAPDEYTQFSAQELIDGFSALAFGSDLRIGSRKQMVRRFTHPIRIYIHSTSASDRTAEFRDVVARYGAAVPNLHVSVVDDQSTADVISHLIDEKDFQKDLAEVIGRQAARSLIERTDAQCMTNVIAEDGHIVHADTFIITDQGDDAFRDCAYHELLHVFGLSNHDQTNPYTTLNQNRLVGYLTVYDRELLSLLYDPRMTPGMSAAEARKLLPALIGDKHAAPN